MTAEAPQHDGRRLFGWLWRGYLARHKGTMAVAVVLMAIDGSMMGFLSYMLEPMFDRVFVGGEADAIWWVGLGFFTIFAIRAVSGVGQKVLMSRVAEATVAAVQRDLTSHLMTLDTAFHQKHPPGYLIERVQGDVKAVAEVWQSIITGAGRDLIALIALFAVAISVDPLWTVIALVGTPILVLPSLVAQRYVRKKARDAREIAGRMSTRLDEIFHGIGQVKLNAIERYQEGKYDGLVTTRAQVEVKAATGRAMIPGLVDLMAGLGFMGVLFYGGGEIISGEKTVGQFMSFFTAIALAFEPMRRLGAVSGLWQAAAASLERLVTLFETRATILSPAAPARAVADTTITLSDVRLSYDDTEILKGISFTAEAGQTTALVGASGAGKSTVFNLLTRLVDADSGSIRIGGGDVTEMALPELRAMFSVVTQDALLFDETIRENILLGRTDVSDIRLAEVVEAANMTRFLAGLPQGLDTNAGPRGSSLSGGQRQRVAIARALLRDAPILLLDEATSALDAASEAAVQAALDRLSRGRTTLVIAHRLATIRRADRIVVMDAGRIMDIGRHDELIARGGLYADLCRLQFEDGPA